MSNISIRYNTIITLVFISSFAGNAAAQQQNKSDKSNEIDKTSSPFEQILVTAQKRSEVATDVGATLSVLDASTLEKVNTEELSDLTRFTPNFDIAETNNPALFVRGVGISDFNTNNNGPIAVYVDEVYRSSIAGLNLLMFDMNRVEVLKGPQGTLFGRNATGGALRLITNKPSSEDSLKLTGLIGNLGTKRFDVAANKVLSDDLHARFSAVSSKSDGYLNNVFEESPASVSNTDIASWRAQVQWFATDDLDILLSAEGTHRNDGGPVFSFQGTLDPTTLEPCSPETILAGLCSNPLGYFKEDRRLDVNADRQPSFYDQDVKVFSVTANYSLGDWIFTSVSSYEMLDSTRQNDEDVSPFSILHADFQIASQTFAQEIRGSYEGDILRGTVGLFYLSENLEQVQSADVFREVRSIIESIDPINYPGGLDPFGTAIGIPSVNFAYDNYQETETYALFSQGEYDLSDSWRLVAGLRYTKEDRYFDTVGFLDEPSFDIPLFDKRLEVKNDNVSYKLGFEADLENDTLVYGSVATGFKSGGFNGGFPQNEAEVLPYGDEKLTAFEIGAKGIAESIQVQWSTSAFYYDYTDMQVFVIDNSGVVPLTLLTNAGDSTIYGFEIDADWRPIDGLSIYSALGFLNSEYDRFDSSQVSSDVVGNSIPYSPETSASLRVSYSTEYLDRFTVDYSFGFSYKSEVFFTPENSKVYRQGALQLWDANVSVKDSNSGFNATLFAENVFDKEYLALSLDFSTFGFNQQILGKPRTFGIRVSYDF